MTKARTLADNFAADINGITAGTGITGGGTSGTVTVTNSMATAIDAKGDLVVGTGADTFSRLAVASTAGYLLSVDSAETTGLKWAAPAGAAGMTLITRQTITNSSGTNIDSVFSSTYDNYFIVIDNTNGSATSNDLQLQFRYGSTTQSNSIYKYFDFEWGNTVASTEIASGTFITISPNVGDGNDSAQITMWISQVGNSSEKAQYQINLNNSSAGTPRLFNGKVNESQTYTGIRLTPNTGTFSANVSIYGLAKS